MIRFLYATLCSMALSLPNPSVAQERNYNYEPCGEHRVTSSGEETFGELAQALQRQLPTDVSLADIWLANAGVFQDTCFGGPLPEGLTIRYEAECLW